MKGQYLALPSATNPMYGTRIAPKLKIDMAINFLIQGTIELNPKVQCQDH